MGPGPFVFTRSERAGFFKFSFCEKVETLSRLLEPVGKALLEYAQEKPPMVERFSSWQSMREYVNDSIRVQYKFKTFPRFRDFVLQNVLVFYEHHNLVIRELENDNVLIWWQQSDDLSRVNPEFLSAMGRGVRQELEN